MEFNNKKLKLTSKLINYLITIVLCGFLIFLFGKLLYDVEGWKARPTFKEFQNAELLKIKEAEIENIYTKIDLIKEKKISILNTITTVSNNYTNAKKSFDNWLAARKTIGSPKEDKEVLSRAKELDKYYKIQQEWKKELSIVSDEILILEKDKDAINQIIDRENKRAHELREKEIRRYQLKVFLFRLLLIFPILLLGIFFSLKFRKHKYWPLFLGFVLFSFYTFFFALIPYLPRYGGYIRYSVGIILTVFFGVYAINKIKAFIERKNKELKVSTAERARKVEKEIAEKALDNHMCPSCGKDFVLTKWDRAFSKKDKMSTYGIVTNFCRFCGLELFKKCSKCDTENFVHLPFCSNCGDKMTNNITSGS